MDALTDIEAYQFGSLFRLVGSEDGYPRAILSPYASHNTFSVIETAECETGHLTVHDIRLGERHFGVASVKCMDLKARLCIG